VNTLVAGRSAAMQRVPPAARRAAAGLLLVLLAAVLVGALTRLASVLLDATRIEVVRVEGSFSRVTQAEIGQSLSELLAGRSLLDVPLRDIRGELAGLSWVSGVDVYRVFPDALVVRITEKVPVAHWNGDGFVSQSGELFQPEDASRHAGLPLLVAPDDKVAQVTAFFHEANKMLMPLGLSVRELVLNEQLAWELHLSNGIAVRVDQQDALARLRRFLTIYHGSLHDVADRIAAVDLRYIGGFAVRWHAPSTTGS
jgi:cell division protein FtsQ